MKRLRSKLVKIRELAVSIEKHREIEPIRKTEICKVKDCFALSVRYILISFQDKANLFKKNGASR